MVAPTRLSIHNTFRNDISYIDTNDWRGSYLLVLDFVVGFFIFVFFDFSDQAVGVLIPRLQEAYTLNDFSTSMVFLFLVIGYFTLAIIPKMAHNKLGLCGVVCMGFMDFVSNFFIFKSAAAISDSIVWVLVEWLWNWSAKYIFGRMDRNNSRFESTLVNTARNVWRVICDISTTRLSFG